MRAVTVVFAVIMLFSFPKTVYAQGEINDIYSELPNDVSEALPEDFQDELENDNGVSAIKLLDVSFFAEFIGQTLSLALTDTAPLLLTLTVTVVLCSLLLSLSKSGSVGRAMSFASGVSLCFSCVSIIKPLSEQCIDTVKTMSGIIKTSLPVMVSISYASGQVSTSAVNATYLNAALMLIEEIGKSVLSPLIAVSFAFTAVSAFTKGSEIDLSSIVASIKKTFIFIISLLSTLLCFIMSFQTVIAKGTDTVLLRSIKFASGTSIPIVGAALSEAAGTYLSGISLIKSSAGWLIAAAIVLASFPMLLKLFAVKICLTFTAFVADILGVSGAIVRDFVSICDMLIALLVTSSLIFVISMGIFASVLPSI